MSERELWQLAATTLTAKELHAYELRYRHNLSERQISLALNISRSSVRSRLENADRKMAIATRDLGAAA